jgi:hypothetical protein
MCGADGIYAEFCATNGFISAFLQEFYIILTLSMESGREKKKR